MSEPELQATIDPPRRILVKTSTGWADLVIAGPPGPTGSTGPSGPQGNPGAAGPPGQGVPVGGTTGQALVKKTGTDFDTQWATAALDLNYDGAFAPGSFKDGDIVVYQGVSYMCVRPTTNPPALWPMPRGYQTAYGTTLPANPYDGQEAILVDSVTNPSYQWRFRYNAASTSSYRWEFVGGSPASSSVDALENVTSTTFVALTTPGPSITLPRAGDYTISICADIGPSTNDFGRASFDIGATGAVDNDGITVALGGTITSATMSSRMMLRTGLAAGAALVMKYRAGTAATCGFRKRTMSVWPVRVS